MPALAPARRRSWVGAALRVGAATTAGGVAAAVGAYYWDPSVRRAVTFWSRVGPIAGHYVFAQKWHASDPEAQRREYERLHDVYAPASLEVVLELRGLLVKFGQQLSSRPELVPHQYVVAFRRLQAEVPAEPASIVIALVEAELGRPIGELYARFDERPCGAASIAQAHRALTPDGREVVVKVQFPLSAPHFHADLRGLRILVRLYSPEAMPLFDEFSKQYLTELDFERERESLETIRNAVMPRFGHFVEVPEVDANRCSSRVLTMGYVPGEPLERSVRAALEAAGVDASRGGLRAWLESQQPGAAPAADGSVGSAGGGGLGDARSSGLRRALMQLVGVDSLLWAYDLALRLRAYGLRALATLACTGAKLALLSSERADSLRVASEHSGAAVAVARASVLMSNLFDVYGFELFELGFFNSDPHPGNVLVMPDGRLGLIDYGQCKRISVELQAALAEVAKNIY